MPGDEQPARTTSTQAPNKSSNENHDSDPEPSIRISGLQFPRRQSSPFGLPVGLSVEKFAKRIEQKA
jgi:hypothetical protein